MTVVRGLLFVVLGLLAVGVTMPSDYQPAGALSWTALACAAALCAAPLLSAMKSFQNLLRTEHIIVMSPVYWLLLDPIQGRYPLYEVSAADVESAFTAILVFAGAVWVGSGLIQGPAPRILLSIATVQLNPMIGQKGA